jgi:hypothetical protein
MKKIIRAQVVAKVLSFPDQIEIQYQPVDKLGNRIGTTFYKDGPYPWEQVKLRFFIDFQYAAECVRYFKEGFAALIRRPDDLEGEWLEPGDAGYKEPAESK